MPAFVCCLCNQIMAANNAPERCWGCDALRYRYMFPSPLGDAQYPPDEIEKKNERVE